MGLGAVVPHFWQSLQLQNAFKPTSPGGISNVWLGEGQDYGVPVYSYLTLPQRQPPGVAMMF